MTASTPRLAGALVGVALGLLLWAPASAQPRTDHCPSWLDAARVRYLNQQYAEVEEFLRDCLNTHALPDEGMTEGFRLLALSYLRLELVSEAQETVLKHLAWSLDYEPDEVADPPVYVALVRAVRQQLTVTPAAPPPPVATHTPVTEPPASAAHPVDVNRATAVELESLPGIGPVLAARIVEYRTQNGPFARPEELEAVRGIGPRTMERLLPLVTAGPSTGYAGGVVTREAAPPPAPAATVDVNTATVEQLDTLPGIGPALAARIVDYRTQYGPFRRVDDLEAVRGIGPQTLERLRPHVTVGR